MEDFIPTRGAQNKKNAEKLHVVATYEAHKKTSNPSKIYKKPEKVVDRNDGDSDIDEDMQDDSEPLSKQKQQELEMKRFRYDVIKFGMSGFQKRKARQAKIELAISLGAKPPKKRGRNYKKLMEARKHQKAQEAKKAKFASGFSVSQLRKKSDKSKGHHKKTKESSGILGVYGKVTKEKSNKNKNTGKKQRRKS